MKHIGEKPITSTKISDETYATILDNCVIACSDVIVKCDENILFLKRKIEPRKGKYWVIGGRMIAGESPLEAAKRKLKQELNLDIDLTRIRYLGTHSAAYPIRQQDPQNNGSHTINIIHSVGITERERFKLNFTRDEYSDIDWVPIYDIQRFIREQDEYLRYLLQTALLIWHI